MIQIKRVYDEATDEDGYRILVDRLWPRGVSKERAKIDEWAKELAPSTELRNEFCHDLDKWVSFVQAYQQELSGKEDQLKAIAKRATVTLVYATKDEEHNQAVVLLEAIRRYV